MGALKPLRGVLYSVQTTLPEAGGRVGEVPVAVSWEWLPGAPCGSSAAVRADLHVNLWGRTTPRTLSAALECGCFPASQQKNKWAQVKSNESK